MKKTLKEKIMEIEERARKLSNQAKLLKAKSSEIERKARTRRLIQIGAIVEKILGDEVSNLDEFEKKLKGLLNK